MAARLKTLLTRYPTVLFTCGLGHWAQIQRLLEDASIRPAHIPECPHTPVGEVKRVVVHPSIAASHMDRFPFVAESYEKWRINSCIGENGSVHLDSAELFSDRLKTAYQVYLDGKTSRQKLNTSGSDLNACLQFKKYLGNLCLLNHKAAPDLALISQAAEDTLSKGLVENIVKTFMDFPWVSPDDMPDYPLVRPSSDWKSRDAGTVFVEGAGSDEKPFYVKSILGPGGPAIPADIPYRWEGKKRERKVTEMSCTLHSWLPWDYLTTALCIEAIKKAKPSERKIEAEIFQGSMLEGIDVKATLRDFSRDVERYHVRGRRKCRSNSIGLTEGFPVVWIFHPDRPEDQNWTVLQEPLYLMEEHVRNKSALRKTAEERGAYMVVSISRGKTEYRNPIAEAGAVVESKRLSGIAIFLPPSFNHRQAGRWAEMTGYRRNPFFNYCSLGRGNGCDLTAFYRNKHGIEIGKQHWTTTLILMALPFAKDYLTIVIPEDYQMDKTVMERAKTYGIAVRAIKLSLFKGKYVERLSLSQMATVVSHEPHCIYPRAVEEFIGEPQTQNRDLVQSDWLNFGKDLKERIFC